MQNYVLSCCSTADLSAEHFHARDIHYVCFHFMIDGVSYPDDLGKTMPSDELLMIATLIGMSLSAQVTSS